IAAAYIANPLDARGVGQLCRERRATVLGATPVFLRSYLRRCDPADLASLDVVAVGAERLPQSLSDAFAETFGVRPVEGYGMTEMGPLVAANMPPERAAAGDPCPCAEGTVGRPVRGVRAKVVDPETERELGPGEIGLLLVTGPNLMNGYLGLPEATAAAIRDGWCVTGDIACVDAAGCIRIVDRQSRFAKIGGEMVPYATVEAALSDLLGGEGPAPTFAVTSVPDPVKGERLVVVHAPVALTPDQLQNGLAADGLPKLFIPGRDSFVLVDALPLNGAGKLDLPAIKRLAREAATPAGAA
ncbi:MAG TPA: AMP-binding protein, partial [Thermomicrobiales bacterium]|nr:AMP-binding protein [Thermomicrobiales bacterium]